MFENFDAELFNVDGNLCTAVRTNDMEKVVKFLANGGNPDATASDFPILLTACMNGNFEIASLILDKGADANARNRYGWSCLHEIVNNCTTQEYKDMAIKLLDCAAYVNRQDRSGETPLVTGLKKNNEEVVALLLSRGASVESMDKDGNYPIYYAIQSKNINLVNFIINKDILITNKIDNLKKIEADIEAAPQIKALVESKYGDYKAVISENPIKVEEVEEEKAEVVPPTEEEIKIAEIKKSRKIGRV